MLSFHKSEKKIVVSDLELSMDYYSTIFGILGENSKFVDEKRNLVLVLVQAKDSSEVNPQKRIPEAYGYVETVEELYSLYLTYKENGALFAFNPRDTYENGQIGKEFAIRDLDGYIIAFSTNVQHNSELKITHPLLF